MNITEALGDISVSYPRTDDKTGDAFEVTSGGIRGYPRDPEPVLCITADMAIKMWHHEILALLEKEKAIGFSVLDGPHLDKWHITVADGKYTHRIAEDRFSVTARIGVISEAKEAAA